MRRAAGSRACTCMRSTVQHVIRTLKLLDDDGDACAYLQAVRVAGVVRAVVLVRLPKQHADQLDQVVRAAQQHAAYDGKLGGHL